MNELFKGINANDSKDLVNFLIMQLHEELNKATVKNNLNSPIIDQSNRDLLFSTFAKDFVNSYKSIISDLFYAFNCSYTQCTNCNNILYNYQTYFFLIFPLEEVRKYVATNAQSICKHYSYNSNDPRCVFFANKFFQAYNYNTVDLIDCFGNE